MRTPWRQQSVRDNIVRGCHFESPLTSSNSCQGAIEIQFAPGGANCSQYLGSYLHVLQGWISGFNFAALVMWSSCFVGMVFGFDFNFAWQYLGCCLLVSWGGFRLRRGLTQLLWDFG